MRAVFAFSVTHKPSKWYKLAGATVPSGSQLLENVEAQAVQFS